MSEPVGRPTIMTPETISKLEHAFSIGCSDIEACFYADISKSVLYVYQDANPEFKDRKEALKANPIMKARMSVYNKLDEDADLSLKFLERKCKDEFSLKQDMTLQGVKDGEPIKTEVTLKPDEAYMRMLNG